MKTQLLLLGENIVMVIWIIGLSGAGKTTLAEKVVEKISNFKHNFVLIDGDGNI